MRHRILVLALLSVICSRYVSQGVETDATIAVAGYQGGRACRPLL